LRVRPATAAAIVRTVAVRTPASAKISRRDGVRLDREARSPAALVLVATGNTPSLLSIAPAT